MNVHQNAGPTPLGRERPVRLIKGGRCFSRVMLAHDACAAFAANADSGGRAGLPRMAAEDSHIAAISHLNGECATARSTAEILGGHR